MSEEHRVTVGRLIGAGLVMVVCGSVPARAQQGGDTAKPTEGRTARHVGRSGDLKALLVVKVAEDRAVVRFGNGPLHLVTLGDHLGRNRAEVKEITGGRLTLDETYQGADGRPNRALIILKEGLRGGTRYEARLEEEAVPAVRPSIIPEEDPRPDRRKKAKKP
jgi:hypothetical protein